MRKPTYLWVGAAVAVGTLAGCDRVSGPTAVPAPTETHGPASYYAGTEYPLHFYGDETDSWEYLTPGTAVYVEIPANDQTPSIEDGYGKRRVCPNDQLVGRNAHLRMNYGLETLDIDFRGPFQFERHVSTLPPADGGSPYPTATYRFHTNAYTRDNKYYAPGGNSVLLACDGNYVVRNSVFRLWSGHLYGKLYNGPIVRNPGYEDPECDEAGGSWGGSGSSTQIIQDPYSESYDPYEPSWGYQDCAGGTDGGGEDDDGGGTQYGPGDSTGGETVDWGTGTGNGGSSVCGAKAVVEYICIDVWVDGEGWVEWGCGFVTTC